jgi:hypothetical protein
MTRTRIESRATFPKLMQTNTQHTPVESSEVCNVYQPLETMYFVLIMNNASKTHPLFARIIVDLSKKNTFQLLGACDGTISRGTGSRFVSCI